MKTKLFILIFAALAAFSPDVARANLTQDFYTYGGHDVVVSAFQRTALIFGGGDYQSLFNTIATASLAALVARIMFGLLFGGFKGSANVATQALLPWFLCSALFVGTVLPRGTLHIYDPVVNKYQAVGEVPDLIVLFAAVTNKIERALVGQVVTAGDPTGFGQQAGGLGFMGLYAISKAPLQAVDSLLDLSLANYVRSCVSTEVATRQGYVKELRKESTDLISSLAKAINPLVWTVVYDESLAANGESMSCTDAWANMQPRLLAQDALKNNLKTACVEMGFNSETAAEQAECEAKMSGIVGAQLMPGKTSMDFLRSAYVAQIMDSTLSGDAAGAGYANFSILNKASGTLSSLNNWLPTLRGVILAVTVGLLPFLSLLILTPLMGKAVKFVFGSFMFLTIWGVTDAVLHQFIIDYSNRLYSEVRQYNLGLDALRFFPTSTEKTLAMFGMVRASGLALAGAIASGVIGLSGSVGAAIGGKIAGDVTATGAQGEQQMLDPGAKANIRKSNQMSAPIETLANENSWATRQTAEFSQQAGGLQQQLGAVEGAGGLDNYEKMRHGQGATTSYRGQGDVALNKEFMKQAESMGIPRERAQQLAAANVSHGDGLVELRRLQGQGFTGQQAADIYWHGKTVDHMQGKSIGQENGFTMYRPVEGQDVGKWGQTSGTWQDGQFVGLQGNTVNVATSDQIRTNYDKAYSQSISESFKADQSLGESVTKSWGNSSTWSQVNAAAQQLYSSTSGSVDLSKSVNSTIMSSIRDSRAVDERTGQTVDKSAWAQVTGGAGTPSISPLKASVEGGASWRVTMSDGRSYAVHQSAEEAKSLQESVGRTYRTTTSDVRSGQYSATAQAALAQVESVMGNKTAAETATISYQRADEMRENQGQSHSKAADMSASLARDFYHYVGEQQFGGGATGDREAIRHIEGLAASGKTDEISRLKDQYFTARNINPETLGAEMPKLKGPDMSKIPGPEAIKSKIETGETRAKEELTTQANIKSTDPTVKVDKKLKTKPGEVDPKKINSEIGDNQREIRDGKAGIEARGVEIKKTPIERLHSAAADAGKASANIINAAGETVPGKIVGGLVDAVPKIMAGLGQLNQVGQDQAPAAASSVQPETVKPVPAEPMPSQQTATIQAAAAAVTSASVQPETVKPIPAEPMPSQQTAMIQAAATAVTSSSVQPETVNPVPAEPMPSQQTETIQAPAAAVTSTSVQPETVKPIPAEPMPSQQTATIQAPTTAVTSASSVHPETVNPIPTEPMPSQQTETIHAAAAEVKSSSVQPETVKPVPAEPMPSQQRRKTVQMPDIQANRGSQPSSQQQDVSPRPPKGGV